MISKVSSNRPATLGWVENKFSIDYTSIVESLLYLYDHRAYIINDNKVALSSCIVEEAIINHQLSTIQNMSLTCVEISASNSKCGLIFREKISTFEGEML